MHHRRERILRLGEARRRTDLAFGRQDRVLLDAQRCGHTSNLLPDGLRQSLTLADEQQFDSGMVHLHYRVVL